MFRQQWYILSTFPSSAVLNAGKKICWSTLFQGSRPYHFNTMQSLTSDEITTSKNPTSANPIILLDYGRLMLGGPSPSASGAFWYQVADKKSVTSTRQILGRCSESMRWWWWSRPHLMRSSLGLRGWPWRGWCTLLHISGAWSHPVWHSGWSGWERKKKHKMKEADGFDLETVVHDDDRYTLDDVRVQGVCASTAAQCFTEHVRKK